jgi:hypothetical protein
LLMNRVRSSVFLWDLSPKQICKELRHTKCLPWQGPVLSPSPYFIFPRSIHFSTLMMEASRPLESLVKTHKTLRHYSNLH